MKTAKTAVKYLVIGLVTGFLVAPRTGKETRSMIWNEFMDYMTELAGMVKEQMPGSKA